MHVLKGENSMKKVTKRRDIWEIDVSKQSEEMGVLYASKSLPWTFNRLGVREGPWTWYYRMMNINKGVMTQESLLGRLRKDDVDIEKEWKDYRTEDTFDLRAPNSTRIDVKSLNYYTDYKSAKRPEFSLEYLLENSEYSGNEWSKFFPWLVPCDQLKKNDLFIFALLCSQNYNSKRMGGRDKSFIVTSPPAAWGSFLNHKKIILAREEDKKGLDLKFKLTQNVTLGGEPVEFEVGYEKAGKFFEQKLVLKNGRSDTIEGTSSLAYIRMEKHQIAAFIGKLLITFKNHLKRPVTSGQKLVDLNRAPSDCWEVTKGMYGDLFIPKPMKLYFIGWIERNRFDEVRQSYPPYAHPIDAQSKERNQPGRSNENGLLFLRSCCYIYPNVFRGGLKNKNYYVLTHDLNVMDEFADAIKN
jgi:hypothetical protein